MYFAFPVEPSSSVSILTSPMATAEDRDEERERKVRERERGAEAVMEKEIKNEKAQIKWEQWESVQNKARDLTLVQSI